MGFYLIPMLDDNFVSDSDLLV
ncbi:unnamed protein product, partial [Rotaria sp. Silwood2]